MPNLKSLLNKISSIKSTKKITSVMKMVASASLVKGRESLFTKIEYLNNIQNTLRNCNHNDVEYIKNKFYNNKNIDHLLLIIISSSKGLCAGYNHTIYSKLIESLQQYNKNKKIDLLFVGKKCYEMYNNNKKNNPQVEQTSNIEVLGLSKNTMCEQIFLDIKKHLLTKKYSNCQIIFSEMKDSFSFETKKEDLFFIKSIENKTSLPYEFEQDNISVLTALFNQFLYARFSFMYFTSFVSENTTRMLAMDSATNNAQKISDTLNIMYNKLRQDKITTEIIEIVGGTNAT